MVKTEVLDADLSSYFDRIPHDKLMIVMKQRIADPRISTRQRPD